MGLSEIVSKFGWSVLVLAFIGCILVGIIKTPINKALQKSLEAKEATEEKKQSINTVYDALLYIGNYIIASVLAVGFNYIFKRGLTLLEMFNFSLQVWLLQNTFFGIWKKLGVKRILCLIGQEIGKLFKKNLDKNSDGVVSADEVSDVIKDVTSDGKVDANKLFGKVTSHIPNLVIDVVDEATDKAGETLSTDTDAAKNELKSKVVDLTISKIKF